MTQSITISRTITLPYHFIEYHKKICIFRRYIIHKDDARAFFTGNGENLLYSLMQSAIIIKYAISIHFKMKLSANQSLCDFFLPIYSRL